jgi:hypothetical protein
MNENVGFYKSFIICLILVIEYVTGSFYECGLYLLEICYIRVLLLLFVLLPVCVIFMYRDLTFPAVLYLIYGNNKYLSLYLSIYLSI